MPRLILVFVQFVGFVGPWLINLMGRKGNNSNFITFTLARVDERVKTGINIG